MSGRLARTLVDGKRVSAGRHSERGDGRDDEERTVAPGVYFCSPEAGRQRGIRRMAIIR